jgi:hypothetical protein
MSCSPNSGHKLTMSCNVTLNVASYRTGVEDDGVGSPCDSNGRTRCQELHSAEVQLCHFPQSASLVI